METKNNFDQASTLAQYTDMTFWFIFLISAICLVGITIFMLFCCVRYSRKNNPKATPIHGNLLLEVMWTVIPTILVMIMFWMSWNGYKYSREVPEGAYVIDVIASQWQWEFKYPRKDGNGYFSYSSAIKPAMEKDESSYNTLVEPKSDVVFKKWIPVMVVPVNTDIKLNLYAKQKDVIHSFAVNAFRIKGDCTPKPEWQKPNYSWFNAKEEGLYDVNCTEFCGEGHSQMNSYIKVVSKAEFDKWLDEMSGYYQRMEQSNPGFIIYERDCKSCHSTEAGKSQTAPSFSGILKRSRGVKTSKGKVIADQKADLDYIKESILKPDEKVVDGYSPLMGNKFANFTDEQIQQIYDYLQTIK